MWAEEQNLKRAQAGQAKAIRRPRSWLGLAGVAIHSLLEPGIRLEVGHGWRRCIGSGGSGGGHAEIRQRLRIGRRGRRRDVGSLVGHRKVGKLERGFLADIVHHELGQADQQQHAAKAGNADLHTPESFAPDLFAG
jgi:hypothetical protein